MARLKAIRTDLDKAESGVWVPFGGGIELKIASMSNPSYKKARQGVLRKYKGRRAISMLGADEILELLKPIIAKYILKDWRNLEDDKGKRIPYSPDKALEFFKDPELADFFDFVIEVANEADQFRQEELEEERKNLPTASTGS